MRSGLVGEGLWCEVEGINNGIGSEGEWGVGREVVQNHSWEGT